VFAAKLQNEHGETMPSAHVMRVGECQKAMDTAVKKVSISHLTHHDLRHLLATRCIESGVDIPTVSRWLGHKDGGCLLLGHAHGRISRLKLKFSRKKSPREPAP
jgi:integrase